MDHLDRLEAESIYILREAYKHFGKLGMLWSIGKDSTVMLWLAQKAFFGNCPFPLIHVDTTHKIPEMIKFRDEVAKKYDLNLIVHTNRQALDDGMGPHKGRLECCKALKTEGLQQVIDKYKFEGLIVGIRRDEEGSRSKERVFSERNSDSQWDYTDQPPELWDQFKTDFKKGNHIRVHPLLGWTELDIWEYIRRENIPVVSLYFSKNGKRYRSLGCAPCTTPVDSKASNLDEIIEELKSTNETERSGRAQDKADPHALEKLRKYGYM
ncbi:sulfate adenylyltransferase subunit CysD [Clostridium felsineum]|uniref:Sulfate adenylyltransferase subunit 2 n=1 Tax=Clostridium felsineum TaxID=36839 RepID=A0A1S8L3N1_9CLOT|nr:sulfate adenylyltransferase subunit CysD [Clostridium felsineum]URZ08998.1 Sulfate adenylyltransferase subunit 2 [Clostridium felsineum]URZ09626.1 Sulfate adenylyltransferase subunit 2 [Clostridium felsineum]